jgi:hypothetical protein
VAYKEEGSELINLSRESGWKEETLRSDIENNKSQSQSHFTVEPQLEPELEQEREMTSIQIPEKTNLSIE